MDDMNDPIGGGQKISQPPQQAKDAKELPARAALVKKWEAKVLKAVKHWEKDFNKMKQCMDIAETGSMSKEWVEAKNYVVPIIARHINQEVASLYARHPTTIVKRKKRMLFKIWDGKPETAQAALEAFNMGDMTQAALIDDIMQGQQYMMLVDKIAKTLEILWSYYLGEQEFDYKAQLKALVRRVKTAGVGYVKLGFQRILEQNPEFESRISDMTSKIDATQRLMEAVAKGEETMPPDSPDIEQLRLNLKDLQEDATMIVREGIVLSFPKPRSIVPDIHTKHLRSLAGAEWVAEHIGDFSPERVKELYKVDLPKGQYTTYKDRASDGTNSNVEEHCCRIWEIHDKVNRQVLTICEGYSEFIKEPATPKVHLERFWPYFPLVFNEVESEETIFPPSDVWNARHIQDEYNRNRQGLREHRQANIPWYAIRNGALSEADRNRLKNHAPHEIVEFNGMGPQDDINKLIQRGPVIAIDPPQYDVEGNWADMLRVVGATQASIGPTSGDTATESSIAENNRQTTQSSATDDLDDLLTNLARSAAQLMLAELDLQTVIEIAGPGAAWPEMEMSREEIAKDLQLDIEAGSSGRPNRAAELADMERAAPTIMQLPGISPAPIAKKYLNLLNIDVEETYVEGLPSITALNQAMGKPQQPPGEKPGDPNAPSAQGGQGSQNAAKPAQSAPQSQPAYPPTTSGSSPASGASSMS